MEHELEGTPLKEFTKANIIAGFEAIIVDIDFCEQLTLPLLQEDQIITIGDTEYLLAEAGQHRKQLTIMFEDRFIALEKLLQAEEFSTIELIEGDPIAFIDMDLGLLQSLIGLKIQCINTFQVDDIQIEDDVTGELTSATAYQFLIVA